jgi:hypothetical protein
VLQDRYQGFLSPDIQRDFLYYAGAAPGVCGVLQHAAATTAIAQVATATAVHACLRRPTPPADAVFRELGDLVDQWITFNEVISICENGYELDVFAPQVSVCAHTAQLCQAGAGQTDLVV